MNIKAILRRYWHAKDVVVTLDDVLPMYGEGDTREEAINDLISSLISLRAMLEEEPDKLSPHLALELDILRRLMEPPPPYRLTITSTGPTTWTSNTTWPTNAGTQP